MFSGPLVSEEEEGVKVDLPYLLEVAEANIARHVTLGEVGGLSRLLGADQREVFQEISLLGLCQLDAVLWDSDRDWVSPLRELVVGLHVRDEFFELHASNQRMKVKAARVARIGMGSFI